MSYAIHSNDGRPFGAVMADYPPPFKYPIPGYHLAIRNALWSIETLMGGQVDWQATFGVRQSTVALMVAQGAYGSQFGAKKRKRVA